MKRVVYLAVAALVAMLILLPAAMGQEMQMEKTVEQVPKTGGPAVGSVLLPAAALLVGSGVLAFAVLRRR